MAICQGIDAAQLGGEPVIRAAAHPFESDIAPQIDFKLHLHNVANGQERLFAVCDSWLGPQFGGWQATHRKSAMHNCQIDDARAEDSARRLRPLK
jgi:hypothetical protein